jgi:hypothetical protein
MGERNGEPSPQQEYRLHNNERFGLTTTSETGAHAIGREALKQIVQSARGREATPPAGPGERLGITYEHYDGSFDTGTRAIRNIARRVVGRDPKLYKRTRRPLS